MVTKENPSRPVTVDDILIGEKILATNVSHEAFMAGYEGMRVEWVNGTVVEMPSIEGRHDKLVRFLENLFEAYLDETDGGEVFQEPMLMRIPGISSRSPDLQILLKENLDKHEENIIIGASDLVVEVVSRGTERTDRVAKFSEYERGGVPEYWILDQRHKDAQFYQLDAETGQYERIDPDDDGIYHSKALSRLKLKVDDLWFVVQPETEEILAMVKAMLAE